MVAVTEQRGGTYLSDYRDLATSRNGDLPDWLRSIHDLAIARFDHLGLPTRKHEQWRFSNVNRIADATFKLADAMDLNISDRDIAQFAIPQLVGHQLVFVNGRFQSQLSSMGELRGDVAVMNLTTAISKNHSCIEPHLARYADFQDEAFTALNTAFLDDGAFIYVPHGNVVNEPIHLLFIAVPADEPLVMHPRNLIVTEAETQATIIEDYVSLADSDDGNFTNAVTEIVVGENARISHYFLERENEKAFNVSTLRVQQQANSDFESHSMLLGASLVRNNIHLLLNGSGCESVLNGLYVVHGRQHVDNHMRVEHAKPQCNSRQFYTGVLDDYAKAVFTGRIVVAKDAQKTDAKQSNMNLLLSEDAQTNTQPQLEIYADDVKCTHGATIGQIDEEAVYYLRSRGIGELQAKNMLVHAFASQCLDRIALKPVRDLIRAELNNRLELSRSLVLTR